MRWLLTFLRLLNLSGRRRARFIGKQLLKRVSLCAMPETADWVIKKLSGVIKKVQAAFTIIKRENHKLWLLMGLQRVSLFSLAADYHSAHSRGATKHFYWNRQPCLHGAAMEISATTIKKRVNYFTRHEDIKYENDPYWLNYYKTLGNNPLAAWAEKQISIDSHPFYISKGLQF